MTNEEAYRLAMRACEETWNDKTCKQIKEALEQQDCISRQAVDTLVDELARAISDERCCMSRGRSTATIMQDILDLPSVTPKEKTGKWINKTLIYKGSEYDCYIGTCSVCGGTQECWNYCGSCGCRMRGDTDGKDNN